MNSEKCGVATFPPEVKPYGLTYAEWAAWWWQRMFSISTQDNPAVDNSGKNCNQSQNGPVWFLAGTVVTSRIVRACTIPVGKALFFPIINSERCTAEFHDATDSRLLKLVTNDVDQVTGLGLKVDGVEIQDFARYRVQTPPFHLIISDKNFLEHRPGIARMVSDGFWVLLKPMTTGKHTIQFTGIDPNLQLDVTYDLTVRGLPIMDEIIALALEEMRRCIPKVSYEVGITVDEKSESIIQEVLKAAIPSLEVEQITRDKTGFVELLSSNMEELLRSAALRAKSKKLHKFTASDVTNELLEIHTSQVTPWPFRQRNIP